MTGSTTGDTEGGGQVDWRAGLKKTTAPAASATPGRLPSQPAAAAPAPVKPFGVNNFQARTATPPSYGKETSPVKAPDGQFAGVVLRKTSRPMQNGAAQQSVKPAESVKPAASRVASAPPPPRAPVAAAAKSESSWLRKQASGEEEWDTDPDHVNRVNFRTGKEVTPPASSAPAPASGVPDWRAGLKKPLKAAQDAAVEASSAKRGLSPHGVKPSAPPQASSWMSSAAKERVESMDPREMARKLVQALSESELAALLVENLSAQTLAQRLADSQRPTPKRW